MNNNESWEQLLTPEIMKDKLISSAFYLTAYELLKTSIIDRIKSFYMVGWDENGEIIDERYKSKVLSKNKSVLYASIKWLSENNVVDEKDIESFERIKNTRNEIAHELPSIFLSDKNFNITERFEELIALIKKIEIWWIINVEIEINPDFDGQEIDENGIVLGSILMINMMLEVISGNEDLLKYYKDAKDNQSGRMG
jgi:hypothetical protein